MNIGGMVVPGFNFPGAEQVPHRELTKKEKMRMLLVNIGIVIFVILMVYVQFKQMYNDIEPGNKNNGGNDGGD